MTTHWRWPGEPTDDVAPGVLALQCAVGFVVFLAFFGALFNGRVGTMLGAAGIGIAWNAATSGLLARRSPRAGRKAALAFGATALGFALFALPDLLGRGDPLFAFWLAAALVGSGSGMVGVEIGRRRPAARARGDD